MVEIGFMHFFTIVTLFTYPLLLRKRDEASVIQQQVNTTWLLALELPEVNETPSVRAMHPERTIQMEPIEAGAARKMTWYDLQVNSWMVKIIRDWSFKRIVFTSLLGRAANYFPPDDMMIISSSE